MKGFLNYIDGNSILHKMHPLSKLILAISLCVAVFVSSSYILLSVIILLNLILALLGDIGKSEKSSGVFIRTLGLFRGLVKISIFLFSPQLNQTFKSLQRNSLSNQSSSINGSIIFLNPINELGVSCLTS